VIRKVLILTWGVAVFWAVTAVCVRLLGGNEDTLWHSGASAVICLVPAVVTLGWATLSFRRDPNMVVLAALGGTGVRIVVVLLVGLFLNQTVPLFRPMEFWLWLVTFYLFTLALETGLLVAGNRPGR
jgi:hypothetical protein